MIGLNDFFFRSQVTSIALELGSLESRCAVLVWNGGGVEASASSNKSFVSYGSKSAAKEDQFDWDDLQIVSKIKCVNLFCFAFFFVFPVISLCYSVSLTPLCLFVLRLLHTCVGTMIFC